MIWIVRATLLIRSIKVVVRSLHLIDRLVVHDEIMESGHGNWNGTLNVEGIFRGEEQYLESPLEHAKKPLDLISQLHMTKIE